MFNPDILLFGSVKPEVGSDTGCQLLIAPNEDLSSPAGLCLFDIHWETRPFRAGTRG